MVDPVESCVPIPSKVLTSPSRRRRARIAHPRARSLLPLAWSGDADAVIRAPDPTKARAQPGAAERPADPSLPVTTKALRTVRPPARGSSAAVLPPSQPYSPLPPSLPSSPVKPPPPPLSSPSRPDSRTLPGGPGLWTVTGRARSVPRARPPFGHAPPLSLDTERARSVPRARPPAIRRRPPAAARAAGGARRVTRGILGRSACAPGARNPCRDAP